MKNVTRIRRRLELIKQVILQGELSAALMADMGRELAEIQRTMEQRYFLASVEASGRLALD